MGEQLSRIWREITSIRYGYLRALTDEEWAFVQEASAAGFPTEISSYLELMLYAPPGPPIYPGVELESEPVIRIHMTQLPGNIPGEAAYLQKIDIGLEHPPENGAWHMFNSLCITDSNRKALKAAGLQPPRPLGYYQY